MTEREATGRAIVLGALSLLLLAVLANEVVALSLAGLQLPGAAVRPLVTVVLVALTYRGGLFGRVLLAGWLIYGISGVVQWVASAGVTAPLDVWLCALGGINVAVLVCLLFVPHSLAFLQYQQGRYSR